MGERIGSGRAPHPASSASCRPDTTKGGTKGRERETIALHPEVLPYLQEALNASSSSGDDLRHGHHQVSEKLTQLSRLSLQPQPPAPTSPTRPTLRVVEEEPGDSGNLVATGTLPTP